MVRDIQSTLDFSEDPQAISTIRERGDRYEAALLFSAIGDALGWPIEFLKVDSKLRFELPIKNYVGWNKRVGGLWWGYPDRIEPGQYSDDTQLSLAVARCISDVGAFEPERFAYHELPLWLHYERGGGRSVKAAARALVGPKSDWLRNFYRRNDLDYRMTGANGATMRNLPISLASAANENRVITDSILNTLITHGHPRALTGTVLYGLAIRYAILYQEIKLETMLEYLSSSLATIWQTIRKDSRINDWIMEWETHARSESGTFKLNLEKTITEAGLYLRNIEKYIDRDPKEYYSTIGALDPMTKGSALSTICAAIYLFFKYNEHSDEALITSANLLGSDTDTISSFVGALFGASQGPSAIPSQLEQQLQDHEYILKVGRRLHAIGSGKLGNTSSSGSKINRRDAYMSIIAWEIGLHEMFWDAIQEGGVVVHPALGRGTIVRKKIEKLRREGYDAKLMHVQFDCGQSCVFHSRVTDKNYVMDSLAEDISRSLRQS
jgi:ADP-ribosylglycohydrolase